MTIIDLTEEKQQEIEKKKIHLVACLQRDSFHFYKSSYENVFGMYDKTTRICKNASGSMDLIILEKRGDKAIFLGYWNDGVI